MSAGKNYLSPFQAMQTSQDMSQATLTSNVIDIRYLDDIAIQLIFTGTPTGTFAVQGSLNYSSTPLAPAVSGTWTSLVLSPSPVASGAADNILINLVQLAFPYIRIVYTKTGGTGTLSAYVSGKSI